jgi:hypothetical protein
MKQICEIIKHFHARVPKTTENKQKKKESYCFYKYISLAEIGFESVQYFLFITILRMVGLDLLTG